MPASKFNLNLDASKAMASIYARSISKQMELARLAYENSEQDLEVAVPFFAALLLLPDERQAANMVAQLMKMRPGFENLPVQTDPHVLYPLHLAIERGSLSLVDVLLEAGANPKLKARENTARNALELAVEQHLPSARTAEGMVRAILEHANFSPKQKAKALATAVDAQNLGAVQALVRAGADFSASSAHEGFASPLHQACFLPEEDAALAKKMVGAMLEALEKASPSERAKLMEKGWPTTSNDAMGSPLHCAAFQGHVELFSPLLAADARLNTPENKEDKPWFTPLMAAAIAGQGEAVIRLLDLGADPRRVDASGRTALHYLAAPEVSDGVLEIPAVRDAMHRAMDRIIGAGADPNAKDSRGKTPADLAEEIENDTFAPLLRKAMASVASNEAPAHRRSRAKP